MKVTSRNMYRIIACLLFCSTPVMAQEGLRPIRGPIVPGFWEVNWMWAVPALAIATIILLALVVWFWRWLRREKTPLPVETYQREVAEMETLLAGGHREEIPARLSRVLREYIEATTGLRAPEQTTEEFLASAGEGSNVVSAEAVAELTSFLALLDEAKFARRALTDDEMRSLFASANRFVQATEERKDSK
jgi:hypothetical protein